MATLDVVAAARARTWSMISTLLRGRNIDLGEAAVDTWTIHPQEVQDVRPAVYLDGHVDRIRSMVPTLDFDSEVGVLNRTVVHHEPTRAYLLRDALIYQRALFVSGFRYRIQDGPSSWLDGRPKVCFDKASVVSDPITLRFFGDFMDREAPRCALANEHGYPMIRPGTLWPHAQEYAAVWGFDIHSAEHARVDRLLMVRDIGENADRRRRRAKLRTQVRQAFAPDKPEHTGVFIIRGSTGAPRNLVNELEIAEALSQRGFAVVDCRKPLSEILEACIGARVVVTLEGSQQSHGLVSMAEGGLFLVIQPPEHANFIAKHVCDAQNALYSLVVAHGSHDEFEADLDDILRVMDKAGFGV